MFAVPFSEVLSYEREQEVTSPVPWFKNTFLNHTDYTPIKQSKLKLSDKYCSKINI